MDLFMWLCKIYNVTDKRKCVTKPTESSKNSIDSLVCGFPHQNFAGINCTAAVMLPAFSLLNASKLVLLYGLYMECKLKQIAHSIYY